ncbi:MAG: hypothetical protein OZ948_18090 [Deltaproteobacteria bacterium]|nr:hypothetical protein [Deltaproteobacteria bacterium]
MDNDKAFAAYALFLFVGVVAVISALVTVLGTGTWPTPLHLAEHVTLGLVVRASYKWVGGWNPADWSLAGSGARARTPGAEEVLGATADAG